MAASEYVPCPACGATIKRSAKACPECGADDETGWSDRTYLDGIDLPDDDEYEEALEREFGSAAPRNRPLDWRAYVAIGLLVVFLVFILRAMC
jgi:hypothetical protein